MSVDDSELTVERLRSGIDSLRRELTDSGLSETDRLALEDWLLVATVFVEDGAFDEADVTLQHVVREIRAILKAETNEDFHV